MSEQVINETVKRAVFECICCTFKNTVEVKEGEYLEIIACPKCNGSFIDVFKLGKYYQKPSGQESFVQRTILRRLKTVSREEDDRKSYIERMEEELIKAKSELKLLTAERNELEQHLMRK